MTCAREHITDIIAQHYGQKWAEYFVRHLFHCINAGFLETIRNGDVVIRDGRRYQVLKAFSRSGEVKCLESGEVIKKFFWFEDGQHVNRERRSCGSIDGSLFGSLFAIRSYMIRQCPRAPRRTINRALKWSLVWLRYYFVYKNKEYVRNCLIKRSGETFLVLENYGHTGKVYCQDDGITYHEFRWRAGTIVPDVVGVDPCISVH